MNWRNGNHQPNMKSAHLKCLLFALLFTTAETAPAQLINGDFETGEFTDWTLFNTTHGGSAITPQVVQFDTAGPGMPSYSAEFEVGVTSGAIGGGGLGQGSGIYQYVPLDAGQLSVSLDIAARVQCANADAGSFELLLDGTAVDSHAFGLVYGAETTLRSTLSYSGAVTAGTHEIAIETLRGYATDGCTPFQYLANISLSVTPVPEPTATGLMFVGLAAFAVGTRRR
jgi:hypothetical protein